MDHHIYWKGKEWQGAFEDKEQTDVDILSKSTISDISQVS